MTRRSLIRLLLSLLLLAAQQMAFSHALSHWGGRLDGSKEAHQSQVGRYAGHDDEGGLSSAFAQGQSCDQCLAFAQILGALGSGERAFALPAAPSCATGAAGTDLRHQRSARAFQARAPPQA